MTDQRVRELVQEGRDSLEEVVGECGAGTGCGGCLPAVAHAIAEAQIEAEGASEGFVPMASLARARM